MLIELLSLFVLFINMSIAGFLLYMSHKHTTIQANMATRIRGAELAIAQHDTDVKELMKSVIDETDGLSVTIEDISTVLNNIDNRIEANGSQTNRAQKDNIKRLERLEKKVVVLTESLSAYFSKIDNSINNELKSIESEIKNKIRPPESIKFKRNQPIQHKKTAMTKY